MLKKRNVMLGLVLLGTLLMAGAGLVGCHRPPLFFGGGCHGKDFPKHVMERMDAEVKELDLTEEQQEVYQGIRSKVEQRLASMARDRMAFFQDVKSEMGKESPDLILLADLLKSHVKRLPERLDFFLDQFVAFYEVLDKEQQGEIIAQVKHKFKKFEAFRALVTE